MLISKLNDSWWFIIVWCWKAMARKDCKTRHVYKHSVYELMIEDLQKQVAELINWLEERDLKDCKKNDHKFIDNFVNPF